MKRNVIFYVICFLLCTVSTRASILEWGEVKVIFKPDQIQKDVTWADVFTLKSTGLETLKLPASHSQDVWIKTHAFPIGMSWRPPSSAGFNLSFDGALSNPQIYIRYSCDKVNWSTWYKLSKADKKTEQGHHLYTGNIDTPYSESKYQTLMFEWWKTKPSWSSDEHEYCEWLAEKYPDFFEKEFPFIGYVQVLLETISANKAQRLRELKINYSWAVSGMQSIPKDESKVRRNKDGKWFFVGKQK